MPNYGNGKIYKMTCGDKFYYGSTTLLLCQRKATARQTAKSSRTPAYDYFNNQGWENVKICLVETYPCKSKEELLAREDFYIRQFKDQMDCLNSRVALKNDEDRVEDREKWLIWAKTRVVCECGQEYSNRDYSEHISTSPTHKKYVLSI